MPCYLFTYHAYGSWLPNRQRGYVKRGQGVLESDKRMHRLYSDAMTEFPVEFDEKFQRWAIAAALESEPLQRFELHFVATDATHVHVLVAWRDDREPSKVRSLIKGSLSRTANQGFHRRTWYAEGGSRKQVLTRAHFDYLIGRYLPKHTGWKWNRERGMHR